MLKKGEKLPPNDHVLRYINKKYVSGNIIQGAGFFRRAGETNSSISWLEFYGLSHDENAVEAMKNINLKTDKNARFAELNVLKTEKLVERMSGGAKSIAFIYDPSLKNKSHAHIHGLPERDNKNTSENELFDDILRLAVTKTYNPI